VAALVVGPLEKPSDVDGVLYTPWDERDAWKMAIAREMRAAGLPVDMNKV
jgi:predicted nucleotide-binding protein